jgi:hypothetical protein
MVEGEPCTVTTPREDLPGRCRNIGKRLACMPRQPPPPPVDQDDP